MNKLEQHESYLVAKRCLQFIESQSFISLRILQAALLLSLYELGNGMYPAAYLTVGHCARLGHAMGIHDRRGTLQMFPITSKIDIFTCLTDAYQCSILDCYRRNPPNLVGSHNSGQVSKVYDKAE